MTEAFPTKVRLKPWEITVIKDAFTKFFLATDSLWLFGSRADLSKRGGDIDLYIETSIASEELFSIKLNFINHICDIIGDQKIDVVLNTINNSLNLPIYDKAKREGVQLI